MAKNPKILVTGYKGGLGKYFYEYFECEGYGRGDSVKDKYYDLIIHCAHDNLDKFNNFKMTEDLLGACKGRFIYMSSVDAFNPENMYGRLKRELECGIRINSDNFLIIRLGALLGKHMRKNNFIKMLLGEKMTLSKESTFGFVHYSSVLSLVSEFIQKPTVVRGTEILCSSPISLEDVAKYLGTSPDYGEYNYRTPHLDDLDPIFEIKKFIDHDFASYKK